MNHGIFAGRLGRDAEMRTTPTGKAVCNFSVGVSTGFGDKKSTLWVDATLWGERAGKLSQYLTKGSSVVIGGDVGIRTYESKKDSKTVAVLTCNVQTLTLMGGREEKAQPPQDRTASADPFGDDIPF